MKQFHYLTFILTVLVIAFTPLDALEISEGSSITLGRYLFVAMSVSAILSGDVIKIQSLDILKILVLFVFWASLTTLWSVDIDVTIQRILLLIQYIIIFIVMTNVLNTAHRLRLSMLGWIMGTSYIAYKTATDYNTFAGNARGLYRVSAYGNPNENSFMLCYALIFSYLIDKTKYRLPSIILTAYAVFAIMANGSRMGIILFIIAVTTFCVQLWREKKKKFVITLIPIIYGFGIYILANLPVATLIRILGITDDIEEGHLAGRNDIWESAINMLKYNPKWSVLGCGWGTFPTAIKKFCGEAIGAHNFYLDLLCTTGIVGLSIIIVYLWKLFQRIKRTYNVTIINYMMLIIPLISMISTNWQSRRWWFLMGAFIYLIYKTKNFSDSDEQKRLSR